MSATRASSLLTPAASQAVDELVNEYRERLLSRAHAVSSGATTEIAEVSLRDVAVAAANLESRQAIKQRDKVDSLLQAYAAIGFLMAVVSFGSYFFQDVVRFLTEAQKVPFTLGLVALSFAIVALSLRRLRSVYWSRARSARSGADAMTISVGEFISAWRELELAARNFVAQKFGESQATVPISAVFQTLRKSGQLSDSDMSDLKVLLGRRNKIVHSAEFPESQLLESSVRTMRAITSRISV